MISIVPKLDFITVQLDFKPFWSSSIALEIIKLFNIVVNMKLKGKHISIKITRIHLERFNDPENEYSGVIYSFKNM